MKQEEITVTCGIPTKNRYDSLNSTLLSIALQEHLPVEVIIVDDSDEPINLGEHPLFNYTLRLLNDRGVEWKVMYGSKKGQHYSHQLIQDQAVGNVIFRIDDDEVAQPDVIRRLVGTMRTKGKNVGAVAPAVMMPHPAPLPPGMKNLMSNIGQGRNVQWFKGTGVQEAEHLYSCFMYRKGINKYDLTLSTVAHREETIFTHGIFKKGWKLFVNHDAYVWHFRQDGGGIRSFQHKGHLWDADEKIFNGWMNVWGYNQDTQYCILDAGLGDHYAFKNIIPELKKKGKKLIFAVCFPDVFYDETDIELISIAEAKLHFGNIDSFNIYKWMEERNWTGTLTEAYKQMYTL